MDIYKVIYFFLPSLAFVLFLLVLPCKSGDSRILYVLKKFIKFLLLIFTVPVGGAMLGVLAATPIARYQDRNYQGLMWSQGATIQLIGASVGLCFGLLVTLFILYKSKLPN